MSVPNTDTFTLQDVVDEIPGIQSGLQACFDDAQDSGFNAVYEGSKDRLSNFRDYTQPTPSSVTISLDSSTTMLKDDYQNADGYRGINFTGRVSGDVITVNVAYNCTTISGNGALVDFYWRQNDYDSNNWQLAASYTNLTGPGSGSVEITGVDYNDTVDLRIDVAFPLDTSAAGTMTITGGTFTSGTGTVSTSSPTSFSLSS